MRFAKVTQKNTKDSKNSITNAHNVHTAKCTFSLINPTQYLLFILLIFIMTFWHEIWFWRIRICKRVAYKDSLRSRKLADAIHIDDTTRNASTTFRLGKTFVHAMNVAAALGWLWRKPRRMFSFVCVMGVKEWGDGLANNVLEIFVELFYAMLNVRNIDCC